MTNPRQLQLQSIIKTLQSKLQAQKTHIDMLNQHQKQKITMAVLKQRKIIQEKDSTIAMLMEQGKKLRQQNNLRHSRNIAIIQDQFKSKGQSNVLLQSNKMELQNKVLQLKKYNEQKMKQKDSQIEKMRNQVRKLQKDRKIMIDQIQKINKFSVQSAKLQPQKEQTLLWVNKLINFMQKTSDIVNNQNKERQQALLNITLHISQELKQLNEEYSKNDSNNITERIKFMQEMQNMIFQVQQDCKQAARTNQDFFEHFAKVRTKEERQYVAKLEKQLNHTNQLKQKQIQRLNEALLNVEKQKKNLLVSLQQLKCFYQLRQKSSKQQSQQLKLAIQDLIQSQQLRQKQYEQQISRMGTQIEHLSVKFYQKIQLPINTVYNKIRQQVSHFQQNYQAFFTSPQVKQQISQFQSIIVEYLVKLNQGKQFREGLKETANQHSKILTFLGQNYQGSQLKDMHSSRDHHHLSFSFSSEFTEENRQREQDKKLVYELATAKKHIQKLKEHNRNLEGKHPPNRATTNLINAKMVELAAQNEYLKEQNQKLQKKQRQKVGLSEQMMQQSRIGKINTALLQQLHQQNASILKYHQLQDSYIQQLSKCVSSLNTFLLSPTQTFQHLIDQIKNISSFVVTPSHHQVQNDVIPSLTEMKAKRIIYQEIAERKADAGVSIQKASNQMTKVLRQMLQKSKNTSKTMKTVQSVQQTDKPKFLQSRQLLQKRVKEVHTQRLKIRQQMLQKIIFLDEKLKTIDSKNNKKNNFPFIRFQQSICKRLTQLFGSITYKDKNKDFKKITQEALNDATSKLVQSQLENQGLLQEIKLLRSTHLNQS